MNRNYYEAEVEAADFGDHQMPEIINQWVSDATGGLIDEIVGEINPETIMYLLNAIYFKGEWSYAFSPGETGDEPFYLSDDTCVEFSKLKINVFLCVYYFKADNYQDYIYFITSYVFMCEVMYYTEVG